MWILKLIYTLHLFSVEQLYNLQHFIFMSGSWERFIKYEHESVTLNPSSCSPNHLLSVSKLQLERIFMSSSFSQLENVCSDRSNCHKLLLKVFEDWSLAPNLRIQPKLLSGAQNLDSSSNISSCFKPIEFIIGVKSPKYSL